AGGPEWRRHRDRQHRKRYRLIQARKFLRKPGPSHPRSGGPRGVAFEPLESRQLLCFQHLIEGIESGRWVEPDLNAPRSDSPAAVAPEAPRAAFPPAAVDPAAVSLAADP